MNNTQIELTDVYQPRPDILIQRDMSIVAYDNIPAALNDPEFQLSSPNDTIMLLSNQGKLLELNLVCGFVWDMMDELRSINDLVDNVIEIFNIDTETVRRDLVQLFTELTDLGLVLKVEAE